MRLTPKEKVKELYDLFSKHAKYWDCYNDMPLEIDHVKQCTLILVNEMLNEYPNQCPKDSYEMERHIFWQEVKEELLKM